MSEPLWSDEQRPWLNENLSANSKLGVAARVLSRWGEDWHREREVTYDFAHAELADLADAITSILVTSDDLQARITELEAQLDAQEEKFQHYQAETTSIVVDVTNENKRLTAQLAQCTGTYKEVALVVLEEDARKDKCITELEAQLAATRNRAEQLREYRRWTRERLADNDEIVRLTAQLAAASQWQPVEDGSWFWSEMDKTVLDVSDNGATISIDDGEHRLSKTFSDVPIRLCRRTPAAGE